MSKVHQAKIIVVSMLLLCMMHAFGFAADAGDCQETALDKPDLFVQKVLDGVQKMNPPYKLTIFTDDDLKIVLQHHQQYCCQDDTKSETCEGKLDGKLYFPESSYLFDHLVNIGMRKFNGIQEHCDVLWIDCETRDKKVLLKERREKSLELAEDTDGVPPSQLYELFKTYWWDVTTFWKQDKTTQIANAYYTMCYESLQIRKAIIHTQSDGINQDSNWLKWCQQLVQKRYLEESAYVQSLMVDKWVQYLYDNMRAYLKNYFTDNRMNDFVDKFGKLDSCLNMVLKYVTRTSCCVN